MQPRILLDSNTPFKEIMEWINQGASNSGKASRCKHVTSKLPQLKYCLEVYFGDKAYKLSKLGSILQDYSIKENGIRDRLNFTVLIKDIGLYEDGTPLTDARLISKVLSILDYTNVGDIEFIKQFAFLEQVSLFDDFGIESYNIMMGKV